MIPKVGIPDYRNPRVTLKFAPYNITDLDKVQKNTDNEKVDKKTLDEILKAYLESVDASKRS